MDEVHIIREALLNYDTNNTKFKKIIKNHYLDIELSESEHNRSNIKFINKNTNNIDFETKFEYLAAYYKKQSIWAWAWSSSEYYQSENGLSIQMLEYAVTMNKYLSYIRSLLITPKGAINDNVQTDINLAVASYIIKKPYIYNYYDDSTNSYTYLILIDTDVIQKYIDNVLVNK
jgi:hypothetical protein